MTRRNRTPEENERRAKIRDLLQTANIGSMKDIQELFKETIAEFMENSLEAELDDELGYFKYDYKSKNTDNSCNGHSEKTLRTSFGNVELSVPRDRKSEFKSQLLKKNQTSISQDIEEKIISMYAKGMSTDDISGHVRDIYGISVSDTTVSLITDKIRLIHLYKDIKELMNDLNAVYTPPDEQSTLGSLEAFGDKWDKKYPKISKSWKDNWVNLSTYFKYPQEIRKLIYTTNAIEGFNRQLRKVTKAKSVFPTDDSLFKMLYLAMIDIMRK